MKKLEKAAKTYEGKQRQEINKWKWKGRPEAEVKGQLTFEINREGKVHGQKQGKTTTEAWYDYGQSLSQSQDAGAATRE
ncbi:hypothetical protein BY996DRAFT_6533702 [Phakopsora pachyrhizi]|nr:hypothetical protein BY996DRAFT_6533702 [Phakopsora pachyrhizi]